MRQTHSIYLFEVLNQSFRDRLSLFVIPLVFDVEANEVDCYVVYDAHRVQKQNLRIKLAGRVVLLEELPREADHRQAPVLEVVDWDESVVHLEQVHPASPLPHLLILRQGLH